MDNFRGAALMVLAMLGFALEDMLIKLLAGALSVGQIMVMLGLGGSLVFALVLRFQGRALFSRNMLSFPIFARAFGELVGALCFILAFTLTPLSSATAILQATPLLVTLGAALFFGESVGWRRWSAVVIGLFGVLLIVRPGLDSFEVLSLFAVCAVFALALRDLSTRRVPPEITSMQLSFLGFLAVIPAGVALVLFAGHKIILPSTVNWMIIAGAITTGIFGYYAVLSAMRVGDLGFVTPFRYTRLLFALILAILVLQEEPDLLTLLGAAIIVVSGIYTVWRESKLRKAG